MKKLYIIGAMLLMMIALFALPAKSQAAQTLSLLNPSLAPFKTTQLIAILRNFNNQAPDPCVNVPGIKKSDGSLIAMKRIGACQSGDYHFDILIDNAGTALSYYFTLNDASNLGAVNSLISTDGKLTFAIGTLTIDVPMVASGSISLTASPVDATHIKLDWTNTYTNLTSFEVERSTSTGAFSKIYSTTISAGSTMNPSYGDANLTASTTYFYRIKFGQSGGTYTPYSNVATAKTVANQNPGPLTLTLNTSSGQITLAWKSVANATGYILERSGSSTPSTFTELSRGGYTYLQRSTVDQETPLTPYYRVKAILPSGYSDYSDIVTLPSCVNVRGNGPIKVIFLNGNTNYLDLPQMLEVVNGFVDQAFAKVDPYKKYQDQFSFYIDLNRIDESVPGTPLQAGTIRYYDFVSSPNPALALKNASNCQADTRARNQYFYLTGGGDFYPGYASPQRGVVHIDISSQHLTNGYLPFVMLHEFGHAFAGLFDEYINSTSRLNPDHLVTSAQIPYGNTKNCSTDPSNDYRSTDNRIYGSVTTQGCTSLVTTIDRGGKAYYRPSINSIMNDSYNTINSSNQMNIVSCGYVIAAIKGLELTKENGQKYFPECATLDTVKSGVPPILPPVPSSVTQNGTSRSYTINGVQFSPTGNSIKLASVTGPSSFIDGRSNTASVFNSIFGKIFDFLGSILTIRSIDKPTAATSDSSIRSITALTPASDVPWTLGQSYPITWSSTNPTPTDSVKVWLKNAAGAYYNIQGSDGATLALPNTGSATITIPNNGTIPPGIYSIEYRFGPAVKSSAPGMITITDIQPPATGGIRTAPATVVTSAPDRTPVLLATTTVTRSATVKGAPLSNSAGGPYTVQAGKPLTFAGSENGAFDSTVRSWNLSDGSPVCSNTTTPTPTCTYGAAGTYVAVFTSTQPENSIADIVVTSTSTVTVTPAPEPTAVLALNDLTSTGSSINFTVPDSLAAGTYQVWVNSAGSAYVLAGTITIGTPPPVITRGAPQNFAKTDAWLSASNHQSGKTVSLTWTNPNKGSKVILETSQDLFPNWSKTNLSASAVKYTVTTIYGRIYYYRLRNQYSDGSYSEYTPVLSVDSR